MSDNLISSPQLSAPAEELHEVGWEDLRGDPDSARQGHVQQVSKAAPVNAYNVPGTVNLNEKCQGSSWLGGQYY